MDVQLFNLLDNHNGFKSIDISEALQPPEAVSSPSSWQPQCHPLNTSESPSSGIDFTFDTTPDFSTASPMSYIQPLSDMFTLPPYMSDPVPFPSGDWPPSSTPMLNFLNFCTRPSTWDEYYGPSPTGGQYGVADATPFDNDPLLYGSSYQSPDKGDFGIDQIPQMEDTATAGPIRTERSCERWAPYRVDNDHEGAQTKKSISQQAFRVLSETPGYENPGHDNNVQIQSPTKRRNKKKTHSSPVQPVSGPSTIHRSLVSGQEQRRCIPTRPPTVETPAATADSIYDDNKKVIKSHGRLKTRELRIILVTEAEIMKRV